MNRKTRPVILILSDQDFLYAGNQLLFQAVRGYIKGGFDVCFITDEKNDSNVASSKDLFGDESERCRIIRFNPPIGWFVNWIRKSGILARNKSATSSSQSYPDIDTILPFSSNLRHSPFLTSLRKLLFNWKIKKIALQIGRQKNIALVCGYEVGAAVVASKVAKMLGLPFFTRYQGTFLYPSLAAGDDASVEFPVHLKGTTVPADLVIMENDGTRGKEVLEMLGHKSERIRFWIDGINKKIRDTSLNRKEVYADHGILLNDNDKVILTLSKMNLWKRHDRIVRLMPEILKKVPNAHLVIGHRGEMRATLEKMVHDMCLEKHVHFTGAVSHDRAGQLLNTCHVYCNVNEHSNLSNPVLEALECGRPVVSLEDGSLNGIIESGRNGFLCPIKELSKKLPEIFADVLLHSDNWEQLSQNALEFAERNLYDWETRMQWEVDDLRKLCL